MGSDRQPPKPQDTITLLIINNTIDSAIRTDFTKILHRVRDDSAPNDEMGQAPACPRLTTDVHNPRRPELSPRISRIVLLCLEFEFGLPPFY